MFIQEGKIYKVYTKGTHKYLGQFTATQDMCNIMLNRLLAFKFNVDCVSVYIKEVSC